MLGKTLHDDPVNSYRGFLRFLVCACVRYYLISQISKLPSPTCQSTSEPSVPKVNGLGLDCGHWKTHLDAAFQLKRPQAVNKGGITEVILGI